MVSQATLAKVEVTSHFGGNGPQARERWGGSDRQSDSQSIMEYKDDLSSVNGLSVTIYAWDNNNEITNGD